MKPKWLTLGRAACTVTIIALTSLALLAQDNASIENDGQKAQKLTTAVTQAVEMDYLLFLPRDYGKEAAKSWPLILFLHGAGERGTNLSVVKVHGPPKIVRSKPDFQFIVVSPQCPSDQRWERDVLLALLDTVIATHRVNTNRIYLTGLSMGGYGTWSLGTTYPERFAAIAPICGGGESIDVLLANRKKGRALKSLPVWAFHGAKDTTVRLEESERMVALLKRVGCEDVKLTIYPEAAHDSWTETYNNPELYEWFLRHERSAEQVP